ncbi:hypothetical protein ACET3Z_005308 [Daucus carota]
MHYEPLSAYFPKLLDILMRCKLRIFVHAWCLGLHLIVVPSNRINGLKIGQVLVVSFLTGLLWWKSDITHIYTRLGKLFFT